MTTLSDLHPGKPRLQGACWAQTEDPSGCDAASPSQGRWDPDSLRPALRLGRLPGHPDWRVIYEDCFTCGRAGLCRQVIHTRLISDAVRDPRISP